MTLLPPKATKALCQAVQGSHEAQQSYFEMVVGRREYHVGVTLTQHGSAAVRRVGVCRTIWSPPALDEREYRREYRRTWLPNGLEVILVHDQKPGMMSAAIQVNMGSLCDDHDIPDKPTEFTLNNHSVRAY